MNSNSVHSIGKYAATMPKSLISTHSDPRGRAHDHSNLISKGANISINEFLQKQRQNQQVSFGDP